MIDRGPLQHDLSAQADAGPLRGRRMVEDMILAERERNFFPARCARTKALCRRAQNCAL